MCDVILSHQDRADHRKNLNRYSEVLDYLSVDSPDSGSMALGGSSPFDHRALDREFSEFFDDREGPM